MAAKRATVGHCPSIRGVCTLFQPMVWTQKGQPTRLPPKSAPSRWGYQHESVWGLRRKCGATTRRGVSSSWTRCSSTLGLLASEKCRNQASFSRHTQSISVSRRAPLKGDAFSLCSSLLAPLPALRLCHASNNSACWLNAGSLGLLSDFCSYSDGVFRLQSRL